MDDLKETLKEGFKATSHTFWVIGSFLTKWFWKGVIVLTLILAISIINTDFKSNIDIFKKLPDGSVEIGHIDVKNNNNGMVKKTATADTNQAASAYWEIDGSVSIDYSKSFFELWGLRVDVVVGVRMTPVDEKLPGKLIPKFGIRIPF